MEKIYDLFEKDQPIINYSSDDVEIIIKGANKNGFLLIQDGFKSVPRKIMTSIGVIEVIFDLDREEDICSEHSEEHMYYQNMFGYIYIGEKMYKTIANNLLVYLYSKPKVLLDFINTRHGLDLRLEDIKILDKKITKKRKTPKIKDMFKTLKRNQKKIKDKTFVKSIGGIIEIDNNRVSAIYV